MTDTSEVISLPPRMHRPRGASSTQRAGVPRLGHPTLPREHGAWVMLLAPALVPLAAARPPGVLPILLLLVAAVSTFCLQHVAGRLLQRRGSAGDRIWFAVYLAILIVTILPLLFSYRFADLVPIALVGAALFAVNMAGTRRHQRKRFDRTLPGEVVGTLALTLTGPAAYVVVFGGLDGLAWRLWGAFVLYFMSGILFVNMLLAASRAKEMRGLRDRWRLGWGHVLYHAALAVGIGYVCSRVGGRPAMLLALAFAPVLGRALIGWACLTPSIPSFKQIGQREALYTVWFAGCLAALLRLAF